MGNRPSTTEDDGGGDCGVYTFRSCLTAPPGWQERLCSFDSKPNGVSDERIPGEESTMEPPDRAFQEPEADLVVDNGDGSRKKKAQLMLDLSPEILAQGQGAGNTDLKLPVPLDAAPLQAAEDMSPPGSPTGRENRERVGRAPSKRRPSIVSSHCSIPETDGALELSYEVVLFGASAEELADEACGISKKDSLETGENPVRQLALRITDEHTAVVSLHPFHSADLPEKLFESLRTTVYVFIVNVQESLGDPPDYLKDIARRVREVRARCSRKAADVGRQPVCCCWLLHEKDAGETAEIAGQPDFDSEASPNSVQSPSASNLHSPAGTIRVVSGGLPSNLNHLQVWAEELQLQVYTTAASREELSRTIIHAMLCEFINGMEPVEDQAPMSPRQKAAVVLSSMKKVMSFKRKKLGGAT